MTAGRIAAAAGQLIGVPFRFRGRTREHGVDCIGLVVLSLEAAGIFVPPLPSYTMRHLRTDLFDPVLPALGFVAGGSRAKAGDIMQFSPSAGLPHLAICDADGHAVHAHASLDRVVRTPLAGMPGPVRSWRFPS